MRTGSITEQRRYPDRSLLLDLFPVIGEIRVSRFELFPYGGMPPMCGFPVHRRIGIGEGLFETLQLRLKSGNVFFDLLHGVLKFVPPVLTHARH